MTVAGYEGATWKSILFLKFTGQHGRFGRKVTDNDGAHRFRGRFTDGMVPGA